VHHRGCGQNRLLSDESIPTLVLFWAALLALLGLYVVQNGGVARAAGGQMMSRL
jgi:hypothetical protein